MTFDDVQNSWSVFLDANTLIYHFIGHPKYGPSCTNLLERIERKELQGFTSSHVLADVAHRLMTLEAMNNLGWPPTGLANRLRRNHSEIPKLSLYRQAVTRVSQMGVQVLPVSDQTVEEATRASQAHELLTGDALIVAIMAQHGLTHLATMDDDFDRVPGIIRYSPV